MNMQEQVVQQNAVRSHDPMRHPEGTREVMEFPVTSNCRSIVVAWVAFVMVLAMLLGLAAASIAYRL